MRQERVRYGLLSRCRPPDQALGRPGCVHRSLMASGPSPPAAASTSSGAHGNPEISEDRPGPCDPNPNRGAQAHSGAAASRPGQGIPQAHAESAASRPTQAWRGANGSTACSGEPPRPARPLACGRISGSSRAGSAPRRARPWSKPLRVPPGDRRPGLDRPPPHGFPQYPPTPSLPGHERRAGPQPEGDDLRRIRAPGARIPNPGRGIGRMRAAPSRPAWPPGTRRPGREMVLRALARSRPPVPAVARECRGRWPRTGSHARIPNPGRGIGRMRATPSNPAWPVRVGAPGRSRVPAVRGLIQAARAGGRRSSRVGGRAPDQRSGTAERGASATGEFFPELARQGFGRLPGSPTAGSRASGPGGPPSLRRLPGAVRGSRQFRRTKGGRCRSGAQVVPNLLTALGTKPERSSTGDARQRSEKCRAGIPSGAEQEYDSSPQGALFHVEHVGIGATPPNPGQSRARESPLFRRLCRGSSAESSCR